MRRQRHHYSAKWRTVKGLEFLLRKNILPIEPGRAVRAVLLRAHRGALVVGSGEDRLSHNADGPF